MRTIATSSLALVLNLAAAAPALALPVCGDGVCEFDWLYPENQLTCPADCPPPVVDRDLDGIGDDLEADLADHFFPDVRMSTDAEDRGEAYLFNGFATPYTVQPYDDGGLCQSAAGDRCLEIRYLVPFLYDHGTGGVNDHLGDSEFYAVLLRRDAPWLDSQSVDAWELIRDITSAHHGEGIWETTRIGVAGAMPPACDDFSIAECALANHCVVTNDWIWGQSCEADIDLLQTNESGRGLHETIYASHNKHALYHSRDECEAANVHVEDCPSTAYGLRADRVGLLQNVGADGANTGFVTTIMHPDELSTYEVWGNQPFGSATSVTVMLTMDFPWGTDWPGFDWTDEGTGNMGGTGGGDNDDPPIHQN